MARIGVWEGPDPQTIRGNTTATAELNSNTRKDCGILHSHATFGIFQG
jgi:hypothetical protein